MSKHLDNFNEQNPDHHKNEVMKMQVHHLISKASMKESFVTEKVRILKKKGYDIDDVGNLVALPNDYQGACHLEVQLHRSNHRSAIEDTEEGHLITYHKYVARLIDRNIKKTDLNQYCDSKMLQKKMNQLSKKILVEISNFEISLTEKIISDNFDENAKTGCRDLNLGDGIDKFREHQKHGIVCKMSNRSGKKGQHYKLQKYKLRTGY